MPHLISPVTSVPEYMDINDDSYLHRLQKQQDSSSNDDDDNDDTDEARDSCQITTLTKGCTMNQANFTICGQSDISNLHVSNLA
ncbi:hypothetical protein LSH36_31g04038 [Paralvinella palmiformis]|uniref:Uncharacterized protein n=1 Tax=Paralvinella palmiformis TaxID=53620 RepID=A0AAD9K8U9_9ANNE|nr:hypothetical protein LSH36_31g04038 [Paralvinella palmiformis]